MLGLRALHKADNSSWGTMDDLTQSCLWQLQNGPYQLNKEKELSSEASTQHIFSTAEFLTDWPCSHFFERYRIFFKQMFVFLEKDYSHWDTHITKEFIKTKENLPFPAVFIMPKVLLSKTTSFLVVSASLVHLICLWGPERARRAPSQENNLHQTSTSSEMCGEADLVQLKSNKVQYQPAVTSS